MNTIRRTLNALLFTPMVSVAVAAMASVAMPHNAAADVLYDTTSMTENSSYTIAKHSYIGGFTLNGGNWKDSQVADDFVLASPHVITGVVADYLTTLGTAPTNGVLVEFFADNAGHPTEVPTNQVLLNSSQYVMTEFANDLNSLLGRRFTVDLTSARIELQAGTWWISIVIVDDVVNGDIYRHVRQNGQITGLVSHARNGGIDHGNNYSGHYPPASIDWMQFGTFGLSTDTGDFSLKIEGTPVALCPEDVTGNGTVDIDDLVQVITSWGPCKAPPCAADVTGNGTIDIDDLVLVITGWGACR